MDVNHRDERYGGEMPDIIDNAYALVDFRSGARAMLDLCMFAEGSFWGGDRGRRRQGQGGMFRARGLVLAWSTRPVRRDRRKPAGAEGLIRRTVEVDEHVLQAGEHHGALLPARGFRRP